MCPDHARESHSVELSPLLKRSDGQQKLAYWGHGANLQSDAPKGLRESWKRLTLACVDWCSAIRK